MRRTFVMYSEQRKRLLKDLQEAFAEGTFARAYPKATPPMKVSIGGDRRDLPYEVIVWDLPMNNSNESETTCADMFGTFELTVGLVVRGANQVETGELLLAYIDCVHQTCMADPTLGNTVRDCMPSLYAGGVSEQNDHGPCIGQALVRIRCHAEWPTNQAIKKALTGTD